MAEERYEDPERQRRHAEDNRDNRETSMGEIRRMVNDKIDRAFADVGIDMSTFEGRTKHAALLNHMRERMAKTEATETTLRFAEEQRLRRSEIGTEARKQSIGSIWNIATGLAGAGGGALITWLMGRHQ